MHQVGTSPLGFSGGALVESTLNFIRNTLEQRWIALTSRRFVCGYGTQAVEARISAHKDAKPRSFETIEYFGAYCGSQLYFPEI
jgi:hypothetical protein